VLVGTVLYAATLRELEGCWTYRCFIPGVNALVATALITERLSKNSTWWRALSQGALLAIYMVNAHAEPWLCVAPLIVALDQMQWATNLIDKLCAPSSTAPASAP